MTNDFFRLGAGWLTLKSEGALRDWAWRRIPWLTGPVLVVLGIAVVAAFIERARVTGSLFLGCPWGLIFPAIGLLAIYGVFTAARRRRDAWPFALTALFFAAALLSLAIMFWPYMIPYTITVGNAAAPEKSLSFLFWGAGVFVLLDLKRLLALRRTAIQILPVLREKAGRAG
jgi:cytochrome d ubiquinol oxidase subunit II